MEINKLIFFYSFIFFFKISNSIFFPGMMNFYEVGMTFLNSNCNGMMNFYEVGVTFLNSNCNILLRKLFKCINCVIR